MDIRQLRAGNLVTTNGIPEGTENGSIYKILNVANSGVFEGKFCVQMECYESAFSYWGWNIDLEPVEITGELLDKIGLGELHNPFGIKLNEYRIKVIHHSFFYDGFRLEINRKEENILESEVVYLHTLQNLILDITGLDLNVDNLITK